MNNLKTYQVIIVIFLFSLLFFLPFTGRVHLFDWDEINFAESAREMIVTGNYLDVQINYITFWEKPPLFIWLQVLSMKIFGINEFAARFPNAMCGFFTLICLFLAGKRLYNNKFGILWAFSYTAGILPFLYFKSGIIDPWFNLFIFLGIHFFILFIINKHKRNLYLILSASAIGLGILTKGPVALLIFGLTGLVVLLMDRFKMRVSFLQIAVYVIVIIAVGGFWFILQMVSGNVDVIVDFIQYQVRLFQTEDAGHGGFLLYHFVVLYIGVFPVSVFAIHAMFHTFGHEEHHQVYKKWMTVLFWVVLILFTIVNTKIVHYSSMCYFPISFLGALSIYNFVKRREKVTKTINIQLYLLSFLYTVLIVVLFLLAKYKEKVIRSGIIKDTFVIGNLSADVDWNGIEWMVILFLLIGMALCIYYNRRGRSGKGVVALFTSVIFFIYSTILLFTPKIERYSQHAAIDFYKSLQHMDVYAETLGFKSYADLFYTRKPPPRNRKSLDKQWLLKGDIDKPVFFVTKIHKKNKELSKYPELKFMYQKNGYVFLARYPVNNEMYD